MYDLLPPWPMLTAFLAASLVLAVTPGPGVLYIVLRSLTQGRASGLASVAGVALGNLGNALGASIGLATLFAVSSLAFTIVKYAGAMYLIWLGIKTLRGHSRVQPDAGPLGCHRPLRVFRDGFLVALLNPKTAMFFAAFLPQFMAAGPHPLAQSALLGALFVTMAALTDTLYALGARAVAPVLARAPRATGRYLAGSVLVGLGCLTGLAGHRSR